MSTLRWNKPEASFTAGHLSVYASAGRHATLSSFPDSSAEYAEVFQRLSRPGKVVRRTR